MLSHSHLALKISDFNKINRAYLKILYILWGQIMHNKTTKRICMNNDLPKLPFQLTALKGLKSY